MNVAYDIPQGCWWTYDPPAPWLQVSNANGQSVPARFEGPMQLRLSANGNSFEARSTSLRLGNVTVSVQQSGGSCTANVTPVTANLPSTGGTASFQISTVGSNCAWNAIPSAGVQIVGNASGVGNGQFTASLPANPTNTEIVETVYIAGKTVELRQQAGACDVVLSTSSAFLPAQESMLSLEVQAVGPACEWRPISSHPWVWFDHYGSPPTGSGALRGYVEQNTTGETRTATVSLLGKTITVTQYGQNTVQVNVYDSAWGGPYTINGETVVGNQLFYFPPGTQLTLSTPESITLGDGRLRVSRGWGNPGTPTQTFTVPDTPTNYFLFFTDYYRFPITMEGNVSGDGSRVDVTFNGTRRDEPDGPYYPSYSNLQIAVHAGSQSRFVRWGGDLAGRGGFTELYHTVTKPGSAVAIFESGSETQFLEHNPARAILRYGSTTNLLGALINVTSKDFVFRNVELLPASCAGISAPFTASLTAPATPTVVKLDLDIAAAALLAPGQYECTQRVRTSSEELAIPVDITIEETAVPESMVKVAAVVEAAAFRRIAIPSDGIASIFGERLASEPAVAEALPLPTALAGTRVALYHAATGTLSDVPLFYVSPSQINFYVPPSHPLGISELRVSRPGLNTGVFPVRVVGQQPSLFSANSDGRGAPAGHFARFHPLTGQQVHGNLFQCAGAPAVCSPAKVDFGAPEEEVYLVLFGTGLPPIETETPVIRIGSFEIQPLFVGPQSEFVGLDQINLRIPRDLAGSGVQQVEVIYSNGNANILQVLF